MLLRITDPTISQIAHVDNTLAMGIPADTLGTGIVAHVASLNSIAVLTIACTVLPKKWKLAYSALCPSRTESHSEW